VRAACAEYGADRVVRWCADLLTGRVGYDAPGLPPVTALGGPHAENMLGRDGFAQRGQDYWPRVWAARALLYAWTPVAVPAVLAGLGDPVWRVREMAAKVARRREVGEAADPLAALVADATPRVRVAAVRALAMVGEAEHAAAIREAAAGDPEPAVRRAAATALGGLARRLDRPLDP
jgi:HEAT repeats/HEAT repeat